MRPDHTISRPRGGYSYRVTDEQIRRWRALPPEVKLQWLEDANRQGFKLEAITREDVLEHLATLQGRGLGPRSRARS